jgi:DNA-damage-inducible protein D
MSQPIFNNKISIFEGKKIRKTFYQDEWWFSVSDVVAALVSSANVRQYIKKMRARDLELKSNWGTICTPVKMMAKDGKLRNISCANTEGIFRIIQSIPSPKAEPFKLWLAKVGYERVQEIENPELAQERMKKLYEQKGYPKAWIDKRL